MSNHGNYSIRTNAEAEAILTLTTETAEARMRAGEPFTALDISNALKAKNLPVRHREVSAVVRGLYIGGGMASYGYDRELIPVEVGDGSRAQAYLYRHSTQSLNDYDNTAQGALPPVPIDRARVLDDAVPAGVPLTPLAQAALAGMVGNAVVNGNGATVWSKGNAPRTRSPYRLDGAVAVPRSLVAQAGWKVGDTLELMQDGTTGTLLLQPAQGNGVTGVLIRVWADLRVRIAKTKLRVAGTAVFGSVLVQKPSFSVDTTGLRIEP